MSGAVLTRPVAAHPSRVRRSQARRGIIITTAIIVVAVALFVATMMIGSAWVSPADIISSLLHPGESRLNDFVVRDVRLPIALTGLAVGLALGVAGPLFQRMLANPLASPDFVGVSSGAALFAAATIILFHGSGLQVSGAALVGSAVSTALIYVLAWRDGITGFRFILIGIGITEFMMAVTGYLLTRAQIWDARAAMMWLVGSVGNAGPTELLILIVVVIVMLPIAVLLLRRLRILELGDDPAAALGVRVEMTRVAIILVGVVLVGFATAAAGPIPFVALMAGPIAVRMLGYSGGGLVAAAFIGASVVLAADLVANHVLPVPLPTGVVTGLVGGPYLLWLLIRINRSGRAG